MFFFFMLTKGMFTKLAFKTFGLNYCLAMQSYLTNQPKRLCIYLYLT